MSGVVSGNGAQGSPPTSAIGAPAVQTDSVPNDTPMQKTATSMSGVGCGVGARGGPPTIGIGDPAVLKDPGPTDIPIAQLPRPPEKAPLEASKSPGRQAAGDDSEVKVVAPRVVYIASDALPCAQMGHALADIGQATLPRPPENLSLTNKLFVDIGQATPENLSRTSKQFVLEAEALFRRINAL